MRFHHSKSSLRLMGPRFMLVVSCSLRVGPPSILLPGRSMLIPVCSIRMPGRSLLMPGRSCLLSIVQCL